MRIHTRAGKFGPRCYDKIAGHALPNKVKVVVVAPNIGAGAGEPVDLLRRIVLAGTGRNNRSNIRLILKLAEHTVLRGRIHNYATSRHMVRW